MADILFKTQFEDVIPFSVKGLFNEPSVAFGVAGADISELSGLKMTPKKLFSEIKTVAEKRY